MAITIQDLIASDTVSQAVDKINFNFDQLILNGGGPVGPAGPQGPPGPIGGRGERGSEWYEGTDNPNVTPPTIFPLVADYYLQSNGDVWEYQSIVLQWQLTGINLTGPAGPTGASVGLSQFGNAPSPGNPAGAAAPNNYSQTAKNVGYPSLMPPASNTISTQNEGVPTFAVGIAGPSDLDYPGSPGIPLTRQFKLDTDFAGQLDSSNTSLLLHQKNSGAVALRFMGGADVGNPEQFEQSSINNLSNITLSADDTLNINVPKAPSSIGSSADIVGFAIETTNRGQLYRSGAGYQFTTGVMPGPPTSPLYNSDYNIEVRSFTPLGPAGPGKFNVSTIGTGAAGRLLMGGGITIPTISSLDGIFLSEANEWHVVSSNKILLNAAGSAALTTNGNLVKTSTIAIDIQSVGASSIDIESTGSGDININTTGSGSTFVESANEVSVKVDDNEIFIDDSEISIIAGTVGSNITIDATTNSGNVTVLANDTITLGGTGGTVPPKIELFINNVTNRATAIQGKMTWTGGTAAVPNNLIDSPVYKHEFTNAAANANPILGGSIVNQAGASSYNTNSGVQYQQYNDGSTTIMVGKPNYPASTLGGDALGIFINDTDTTVPNQFLGSGSDRSNPIIERFRVDNKTTKISNNWLLGGDNGHQTMNLSPMSDPTDIDGRTINVTASTPYLRVNIGQFTPLTSASALTSLPHQVNTNWECDLVLKFNGSTMVHGQQFMIEIFSMPNRFEYCSSGACYFATQYGKINVYYENLSNSGAITRLKAGEVETESTDITTVGATTQYKTYNGLFNFSFSNMGPQVFYNGSQSGASGGITLQKGWTVKSLNVLSTFIEQNIITYSMSLPSGGLTS